MALLTFNIAVIAALAASFALIVGVEGRRLLDQVDIYNVTALEEYRLALKQKHFSQKNSCPPQRLRNNLAGRLDSSFGSLNPRQSCTGNQNNYCFGSTSDGYCADCGICCTQSAGPWCCITNGGATIKTCCPADTGLANGQQGCCFTWQTCDSTTGCTDPS
jgi:hypothetical protein